MSLSRKCDPGLTTEVFHHQVKLKFMQAFVFLDLYTFINSGSPVFIVNHSCHHLTSVSIEMDSLHRPCVAKGFPLVED